MNTRYLAAAAILAASASTVYAPAATAATSSCLTRSGAKVIAPPKVPAGQRLVLNKPATDSTFDMRDNPLLALPTDHMLELRYAPAGVCVTGAKVVGSQPRTLTWQEVKDKYDHGGISWVHALTGDHVIENSWIENVEDPIFMPRDGSGPYESNLTVSGSYGRYGRDDLIEADGCFHQHTIVDSLFEEQHTAFSARPGGTAPSNRPGVWTVTDSLLGFSCKPDTRSKADGAAGECPKGQSVGGLFKVSACFGKAAFTNVTILIPAKPVSGAEYLNFPAGSTAQNVTIVWTGPGAYPGKTIPGVTVTTNKSLWDSARAGWLSRHGCTTGAGGAVADCAFLHH